MTEARDFDLTAKHVEFRAELSRLTDGAPSNVVGEKKVGAWLQKQKQEIAKLCKKYPHTVRLHTQRSPATDKLNCFMFAFGIEPDVVKDMCSRSVFPGTQFVQSLLEEDHLIECSESTECIVVYLDEHIPKHAGKWTAGKVISKWGGGATHIWQHGLFEVPSTYGRTASFFAPIRDLGTVYCRWARRKGL